jgi:hypothetical protein
MTAARVNAAVLQHAQVEAHNLLEQCRSSGAFQIDGAQLAAATAAVAGLESELARVRGPQFVRVRRRIWFALVWFRVALDDWTGGSSLPGFLIALIPSLVPFLALLLLAAWLQVPALLAIPAAGIPSLLIFAGITTLLAKLPLETARGDALRLSSEEEARRRAIGALSTRLHTARITPNRLQQLWDMRAALELATRKVDELQAYFQDRRHRLLVQQWRHLRGIQFEQFLVEVFEALGYIVSTTRTTGDQGVDLLATKGNRTIAIQAKGYANSVGNDAVQQAFAGKAYYRCNCCAVVTNSSFTKSAEELATSVDCLLIDGDRLPLLIEGKLL